MHKISVLSVLSAVKFSVVGIGCIATLAVMNGRKIAPRKSSEHLGPSFVYHTNGSFGLSIIIRDPDILGGEPVFSGTRVPFQALIDYLEGGDTLDEFLDDFPTVSRESAIAALEEAKSLVIAQLR